MTAAVPRKRAACGVICATDRDPGPELRVALRSMRSHRLHSTRDVQAPASIPGRCEPADEAVLRSVTEVLSLFVGGAVPRDSEILRHNNRESQE
ncbi:hypothetical protein QIS74_05527 [Colletotrichum tabaci]|uniref:Uncharacterized protein n=1 Tax=Colletotrichum tabaci TaxID=1209068 RepID=A0AAV9TFA8_9PEZI